MTIDSQFDQGPGAAARPERLAALATAQQRLAALDPALQLVFAASFFLGSAWRPEQFAWLGEAANATLREAPKWYRTDGMRAAAPVDREALQMLTFWLTNPLSHRLYLELALATIGPQPTPDAPWAFQFLAGSPHDAAVPAVCRFIMPAQLAASTPEGLVPWFTDWCQRLQCISAFAGYAVVPLNLTDHLVESPAALRAFLLRFRGVDCGDIFFGRDRSNHSLAGLGWLNFVAGAPLATLIDSTDADAAASKIPNTELARVGHGLLLKLGSQPVVGDRNRNEDMTAYQHAWRWLSPAFDVWEWDRALLGEEESAEWFARFEA